MNWIYKKKEIKSIEDIPEGCPFFIYKITFPNGEYYIGSKQIFSYLNVKMSKKRVKEVYSGKGRKPRKEAKIKESRGWKEYISSSSLVKERIESGEKYTKEIIEFLCSKEEMFLKEAYLIIEQFLKRNPKFLNGWISIKTSKLI